MNGDGTPVEAVLSEEEARRRGGAGAHDGSKLERISIQKQNGLKKRSQSDASAQIFLTIYKEIMGKEKVCPFYNVKTEEVAATCTKLMKDAVITEDMLGEIGERYTKIRAISQTYQLPMNNDEYREFIKKMMDKFR